MLRLAFQHRNSLPRSSLHKCVDHSFWFSTNTEDLTTKTPSRLNSFYDKLSNGPSFNHFVSQDESMPKPTSSTYDFVSFFSFLSLDRFFISLLLC
ncbi:hypothetical protein HMI56_004720 [Coelomomyces lativittatus]|nr:hypothetical protein HMI56_004720 [Coelomomyces lativittatus]